MNSPNGKQHEPDRLPPNSREAEKAVLGSVLRYPSNFGEVAAILRKADFYLFAHQKVWEAFAWLDDNNQPIDPVTVADRLNAVKGIEDIGGHKYLVELWDSAPTPGGGEYYAGIVREASIKRELIHVANEIAKGAFAAGTQSKDLVSEAEHMIFQIAQRTYVTGQVVAMPDAVRETLEMLDRRSGKGPDGEVEESIMSGWTDLDALTGGFHKGELVVIAARPSVGKTLFAMNLAANIAAKGSHVYFASLEQGRTELVSRWLCRRASINSTAMRKARFHGDDMSRLMDAADYLRGWGVYFDDAGGQTAGRIVANARRTHAKHGLDLIVVDYLQLMEFEQQWGTTTELIGANARRLKNLARELKVPLVLLSQVNRDAEKTGRRPRMSDLRSSGEIEQHADTVIILHKPQPPDDKRDNDLLDVIVEKQRNGPLGEVQLLHRKRFFDIANYAALPPEVPNGKYQI